MIGSSANRCRPVRAALAACCVWLAAVWSGGRAEELTILNQIQERHERVHQQVAPAVVALQCLPQKDNPGAKGKEGAAPDQAPPRSQGFYGTGVVVSPDGLVLTSSTVVPAGARNIQVFFPDGKVMEAKILATDSGTESSVLQVVQPAGEARKPLPHVELADSAKAGVGELAYTAGNPFQTISRDGQVAWSVGTISGQYNIASADEQSRYRGLVLETDAAVNPGSDGGPLLDANGRLLGILSLCFCESRWLGTAIPVHLIQQALPPLREMSQPDARGPLKPHGGPDAVPVSYAQTEGANAARSVPDALRYAARAAAGAVVKIKVKRAEPATSNGAKNGKASLAERLRHRPDMPVTGVIIDPDGCILTSAFNVAGDVAAIEVILPGGKTVPATLLGRHFGLDVAALKIQPAAGEKLPAVPLAPEPAPQIGRFVAVLGASEDGPLPTQTSGIVSAVARLDGCGVQTDAMINYGNSGGPVVDLRGRLVGLAAHVRTDADCSQQNSGVGFFTRSDKILEALVDLKAGRDIKAPAGYFLDIIPAAPVREARGVKIEAVVPGSIAAAAKLQAGDVIVAVDGMDTHSWLALVQVLQAHKPGDAVEITYVRGAVTSRVQTVVTAGAK